MPVPAYVLIIWVAASTRRSWGYNSRLPDMKRFPVVSTATPEGFDKGAEVAGPPSPLLPNVPLPAMVVMIPVAASTRRILILLESAIKTFPALSTATADGLLNSADVAGPPSPLKPPPQQLPWWPFPATVVITWVAASTRRIRWLNVS